MSCEAPHFFRPVSRAGEVSTIRQRYRQSPRPEGKATNLPRNNLPAAGSSRAGAAATTGGAPMTGRILVTPALAIAGFALALPPAGAPACAPAPPSGKPVVNADQTVVIVWDAATKTQHLIRQAS